MKREDKDFSESKFQATKTLCFIQSLLRLPVLVENLSSMDS